ncbi:MMPL family transporter [Rhodoluna sp. KAS3]|uniref:MMPL family transporter n=1 Tax=Rhodoluna sp. KAS3 TaxID=942880 RepID=UPI00222F9C09|nr:MMPL family transporter [Rhodoluna sp. KAS3]BDS49505.1 membrane protein [Rhodoluna sp. KAS3]
MAELLYRLGQFSAKRAWLIVVSWVLILASMGGLAIAANAKLSTSLSIAGIESQLVIDQLKKSFPDASRGSGQVVFHATDGVAFTQAEKDAISAVLAEVNKLPSVADTLNPFETQESLDASRQEIADGYAEIEVAKEQLAQAQAAIDEGLAGLEQAQGLMPAAQLEYMRAELADGQAKIDEGLAEIAENLPKLELGEQLLAAAENFGTVSDDGQTALAAIYFDGPLSQIEKPEITAATDLIANADLGSVEVEVSQDLSQSLGGILGIGEAIGLMIAAVVLFVMLGTFIGAGLPVLSAILGVGISAAITLSLASVIEMTSTTPILGVMLGLAVGIDYSLFVLNRHRRQLKTGMDLRESIALANGTSGNAVLFAGLTVVIALVALNLTGVGFLGMMGSMGAIAILISVAAALTFTPALLSLVGMRILSEKERAAVAATKPVHSAEELHDAVEAKASTKSVWAAKHPWLALLFAGVILATVALPSSSMRLGLPDGGSEPEDSTAYRAYTLTTDAFGEGANGQIISVVAIESALDETAELELQAAIVGDLMALDNISAVVPGGVSDDGKTMIFSVVPSEGPSTEETENLVRDIRALESEFAEAYDATLGVTGITATNIDISQKLNDALPIYLGTVLLLSILLMTLVFRSIAVPIIASVGFLLTVFATLGAVVAVHQWGWLGFLFDIHNPGPILSFLPTMLIGILFGLAMDYQLFLVSGMREAYVHGKSAREAIDQGIHLGRAVVVAAAIIMITVFGGFAFSHVTSVRPIGFGLAIGVLIDAFLVRLILVPAVMSLLGDKAWWIPKWLDRVLPDVDVEGAKLERSHVH